MIDQATVDKIIDSANILEVVSDFVTLRKRGVNYVGLCPFHDEKTPSFSVSPSKGICKCFSCGKGGSAVHFIMEHEQLSYYEALKYLAKKYNIEIYTCHENEFLKTTGVHTSGCMNQQIIERALGHSLKLPKINEARQGCRCLLNNDIGVYNTCLHGCLYCYANYDRVTVLKNVKMHNKKSPFLIGDFQKDDIIKEAKQVPYIDRQLSLF